MDNNKKNSKIQPTRDDEKYRRIERYYNHELELAVLYEVLLRLGQASEPIKFNKDIEDGSNYEIKYFDWELYVDILIAHIKSDLRKSNPPLETILLNQVHHNLKKFKSNIINGIRTFVELEIANHSKQNKLMQNQFGFLKNEIKTLEDMLTNYIGISNPKAINYLINLFQFPQTIIKPKYSHNEIEKLQQYNKKIFVEIDLNSQHKSEIKFINDAINSLYNSDNPLNNSYILIEQIISKKLYKEKQKKIKHNIKKNNSKTIQEKIADMFFIYDSIKFGLDEDTVIGIRYNEKTPGLLTTYYYEKELSSFLPKTAKSYYKTIQKITNSISKNHI